MSLWTRIVALLPRRQPGEERVYIPSRQAGVNVTPDTALTFAAVWACVSVISRTVAALPWHVYERSADGRRQLDNQLAWLLNTRPNPEMSAFAFREALMVHVLTWGNAYAEIQRDNAARPIALYPMTPDRVKVMRDETGTLYYEIEGDDGVARRVASGDVMHLHGLGFDGLVGYSPVAMASRSIGLGMAQDVFGGSFYANGVTFGATIEVPATMTKEQISDAEAYYNDRGKGPEKAFRIKVAPAGTKIHGGGMPLTDAQFLESRKFSVAEVARWYGVPPHKIGDLDRATNNNIEHQGIEFVTDAIVPWAVRLEQEANAKLLGARAQGRIYTKLNLASLMRGDAKSRAEYYRTMTQIGAMSINEVRALEEMNGIGEDGDVHLVQVNQTTLERLVEGETETDAEDAPGSESDAAAADSEDAPDAMDTPDASAAPEDNLRQRLRADSLRLVWDEETAERVSSVGGMR